MEEPTQTDFIQQLTTGIRQSIRQFAQADRQARQQQEGRLKPVQTEPSFLLRRKDVYAYLQTHLPR